MSTYSFNRLCPTEDAVPTSDTNWYHHSVPDYGNATQPLNLSIKSGQYDRLLTVERECRINIEIQCNLTSIERANSADMYSLHLITHIAGHWKWFQATHA